MVEVMEIITVLSIISTFAIITVTIFYKNMQLHKEAKLLHTENASLLAYKTIWQEKEIEYKDNIDKLTSQLEKTRLDNGQLEKDLNGTKFRLEEMTNKIKDWELVKEEMIKAANSAVYKTGMQLSSHLLAQHTEQAKVQTEENLKSYKNSNEELQSQFNKIIEAVAILSEQVKSSSSTVNLVKQALLEPSGAGYLSELALENLLKNSGLEKGRDYLVQASFTIENEAIRPDAVVFLPQDNLMIIDSKSSSFFLEIAKTEGEEEKKLALQKLKISMNNQLKSLASKDYKEGVMESLSKTHKIRFATVIMFLPSDGAFETLQQADSSFIARAWDVGIIPVGPAGLLNILLHAKFLLNQDHQIQNYEAILQEISKLLNSVGILADHAQKLGHSLKSTMQHYDKFAGSFNKNFMHKAQKLTRFGITLPAAKQLNSNSISRYYVIGSEEEMLEENEA